MAPGLAIIFRRGGAVAAGKSAAQHGARTTESMQSNRDWWPEQLNLKILHQHGEKSNPMG